jgi:drug/metabolite transporter (DMT)-like permease
MTSRGGLRKQTRSELALIGVTVIWGSSFVIVKNALSDISPLLFLALRFSLAGIALGFLYRSALRQRGWMAGALAGGLLFGAFACQTLGLERTTPSNSAFLTSLSIPMVPLANSLVYKSRPRAWEAAGILVASLGMFLMTFPFTSGGRVEIGAGSAFSLMCAVLFALHIVVIAHYAPVVGYKPIAVIQIMVVACLASSSFWMVRPVRFSATAAVATAVLVTGLLATALAFTTMAWAQQYTTATRAALIFALEPVIAWATSYALTGEAMGNRGKAGAGLILAGILLVEAMPAEFRLRDLKRLKPDGHHN